MGVRQRIVSSLVPRRLILVVFALTLLSLRPLSPIMAIALSLGISFEMVCWLIFNVRERRTCEARVSPRCLHVRRSILRLAMSS